LLVALDSSNRQNRILMIVDQQNIDVENFDLSALPSNIQVNFITRKNIRKSLDKSSIGLMLRLVASLNVKTFSGLRRLTRTWLFAGFLSELRLAPGGNDRLFLFNDRNRIARLFRLAFADYAVIEDGLSNYSGKKLKALERTWRFITGNDIEKRYLGDDHRCHSIFLLNPSKAPAVLMSKVRPIDFIDKEQISSVCFRFFRYADEENPGKRYSCILATQPISVGQFTASGFDLVVYSQLLEHLSNKGVKPAIKVHPREDVERYRDAFPGYEVVGGKVPLELMIFGAEQKCDIVSIYSTAGMGFEQYCRRVTLVKEDEAENMADLFASWRREPDLLDGRIADLI